MSLPTMTADVLLTCPLDEAHRILKSRMQFHLVRCFKNHPNENKMRCPWNPLHFVDRCEYLDHCHNKCDNLVNAIGSMILSEENAAHDVGSIPLSVVSALSLDTEEDWDADPCPGTYDPLQRLENRPILRGSIGLSKAKKKQFQLEERRRHQQMVDVLPIHIDAKATNEIKPSRRPHTLPFAMSADASMLEDANTSRMSNDGEKYAKWPEKLRQPHAPSPGLMYEAIDDFGFVRTNSDRSKTTLFDSQFEQASPNADASNRASSSRNGNLEALQKMIKLSGKTSNGIVDSAETKNVSKCALNVTQNDVADVSESGASNIVDELTQQLANLESAQKKIDEKKAAILRQISQHGKSNANSQTNEEETRASDYSLNDRQINLKCAANLGKPVTSKNSPFVGIERGVEMDCEALKISRAPGIHGNQRNAEEIFEADTKENLNPFLSKASSVETGNPFVNVITKIGIASNCGYEHNE